MDIGDKLKSARETMGFTLDEVEEETKIRRKYLKALEEEQFHILPGPVYARAFLKNYAKYLRLDVDELLAEFNRRFKVETAPEPSGPVGEEQSGRNVLGLTGRRFYPILAVVILGLAVTVYFAALETGFGRPVDQAREGGSQGAPAQNQNQPVEGENPQAPAGQPQPGENAPAAAGVNVTLSVKERRSWIRVVVDGNPAFQGILDEGQSKIFEGSDKIYVRLGDAGAVEVLVNGENLGRLGGQGVVVEREFTTLPRG